MEKYILDLDYGAAEAASRSIFLCTICVDPDWRDQYIALKYNALRRSVALPQVDVDA